MNKLGIGIGIACALAAIHCSLVVGTETRTVGGSDAGVGTDATATPDAKPPFCNFGGISTCTSNAQTCKKNCDDARKSCRDGCGGGPSADPCNKACETTYGTCKDGCESQCERCGTDLGCSLVTTCQNAVK